MSTLRLAGLVGSAAILATTSWSAVSGRLVFPDGRRAEQAVIEVYSAETAEDRAERVLAGRARAPLANLRSNSDGSFRIDGAGAVVELSARVEGYAPAFDAASDDEAVTIELKPASRRRGVVTAKGKPVPGALVVWSARSQIGEGAGEIILRTDEEGSYEVPDPDVWAAHLLVSHPDFALLETTPALGRRPSSLAHSLDVGTPIEGVVQDARGGRAVVGASVWLNGWPRATSIEGGAFRIGHAPQGWRVVEARAEGLFGSSTPAAAGIVIRLEEARSVAGVVRDAASKRPLAGAVVTVYAEERESTVTATSDARGHYVLPLLAPARYHAWAAREGYSPSILSDEASKRIDLRKRRAVQRDFELVKMRSISGRVESERGEPVEGALVWLAGKGDPAFYALHPAPEAAGWHGTDMSSSARSGRDGAFTLTSPPQGGSSATPPRETSIFVLKQGYAATRVDARERPLVVRLTRGVEIRGTVRTADGEPLPEVAVTIAEEDVSSETPPWHSPFLGHNRELGEWTRSDANGHFVAHVQPRVHRLLFSRQGYAPRLVPRHDAAGGRSLDVVLEPGVEVRGKVVHDDGRGVGGTTIFAMGGMAAGRKMVVTEDDGAFAIDGLAPGRYELFVANDEVGLQQQRSVEAPSSDLVIELPPTGTIRGRVVDARSREPVPQFEVSAQPADDESARAAMSRELQVSDPNGAFVVAGVPVGDVTLTIKAEGYVAKEIDGAVVAGDAGAAEIEVALDAGATIRGRVTTIEQEGIADVAVTISEEGAELSETTDEEGEYELRGVRPGRVKIGFRHDEFISQEMQIDTADTGRVDATLARGLSLRGVVVRDGAGVANARVYGSSSGLGADGRSATTNESGRFTLAGLAPGRYSIKASAEDESEASLEDIDVEKAGPLRLVLERPATAVLWGTVVGVPDAALGTTTVSAESERGRLVRAYPDGSGNFRMEKAPVGRVKVRANVATLFGTTRSSKQSELTLAPGSETQTTIELHGDASVTGIVTRDGAPVSGATISFQGADDGETNATTRSDATGRYELTGLEAGRYTVEASADGASYETEYATTSGERLDIDLTGAGLRGTVVEATGGTPLSGVHVSLWRLGSENTPATSLTANSRGEFAFRSIREGRYRLLTARDGYGQQTREIDLSRGATSEVMLELEPSEGVSVTVVDARNGRPLDATIVVRDLARRIVANRHSEAQADDSLTIALADGSYLLSTSASGYGTATVRVTAPSSGLRLELTPGGTLVVESTTGARRRMRLIGGDGEEYVRCWCNGLAEIVVKGRRTTVPNITPGTYSVELIDEAGSASQVGSVVIVEGKASTLQIE